MEALGWATFTLDNWLELAHQVHNEVQYKTAVWADIILRQQNGCRVASQIGPWYEFAVPCQCTRGGPRQPMSNFA
jgi:hypothetical protein